MAITTRIAPMYAGQKLFAAVLCAVFGVWGAYDYFVKYPAIEARFQEFEQVSEKLKGYSEMVAQNQTFSQEQAADFQAASQRIVELAPGGAAPRRLNKWDRPIQWVYMLCLPFAPWFFIMFLKAKKQKYTLEDDGSLHFTGDKEHHTGVWAAHEIVDIDMNRWMAKSIAYAVHADGRRLMLDAYIHKDLHLIVGALASKFYPDKWDAEAKVVKHEEEEESLEDESIEQQAT